MKMMLIIFVFAYVLCPDIYADYDYSDVQTVIRSAGMDLNIEKSVDDVMNGENIFDIKKIISSVKDKLFYEIMQSIYAMKSVIIICIIGAVFKCISLSSESRGANEMGFYVCYCSSIVMLISQFKTALEILSEAVETISDTAVASMPVFTGMLAASGNIASAQFFYPLISAAAGVFAMFIKSIFIPLLNMTVLISMINFLNEKEILSKLSEFMRKMLSFSLKMMAVLFCAVLSVHTVGASVISSMLGKGVKTAVGFVPVVGEAFSGTMDSIAYMSTAVKSGFGTVMILGFIMLGIIPFAKLVCIFIIYKLTAVFAEPVSDPRITECIDAAGECMIPVIGAFFTVMALSVMTVIMIMGIMGI